MAIRHYEIIDAEGRTSGPTRKETRLSEAQSYADLAGANHFFGILPEDEARRRILLENQALDSYSNVLFSLMAYWRHNDYRSWPERITIVSHEFKRSRIVNGHCAAIGLPLERIQLVGIDPPGMIPTSQGGGDVPKTGAMVGVNLAVDQWAEDPHGAGPLLSGKRQARNPWRIDQKLFRTEHERASSGVSTQMLGGGGETLLDDDNERPWA